MRIIATTALLASAATLAACATYPEPVPVANNAACGTYGYVDVNADGMISGDEWNTWRSGAYSYWDINANGRVERSEFEQCWRAGGFYQQANYDPEYWNYYWTAFDANNDGWLTGDEYWSAAAWARIDANANGVIDSAEWNWWDM